LKPLFAQATCSPVEMIAALVEGGLRERFAHALEAMVHPDESVESGRAYVAAYIEFMHYAQQLRQVATSGSAHAGHEAAGRCGADRGSPPLTGSRAALSGQASGGPTAARAAWTPFGGASADLAFPFCRATILRLMPDPRC
jgi:hypothetical protein